MQEYQLVLRNDKIATYKRFSLFLFLLNAASVIFYLITRINNASIATPGIISLLGILVVMGTHLATAKNKRWRPLFFVAVAAVVLFWIYIGLWWVSIVMITMFYLYTISDRQLVVKVNTTRVEYPSFPKKLIPWSELTNLILKDGLLTIDFRNNRIIQQPLGPESKHIDEREFNEFCTEQLNK